MARRGSDKPPGDGPQPTVFQPQGRRPLRPNSIEDSWLAGASTPPGSGAPTRSASYGSARAGTSAGRIPIGSVLNHIYEVRRFIGRGGMGEVYEGVNVNTDERVAIKVILEHLAEDPRVQALFRAEANVLTRLSHEALVQYRLMAREPTLNVLYIVTDFVDGVSLEDQIGHIRLSEQQLTALMRRLAEGLAAAHARNVYHRDVSPDNILMPEGRLDAAKIIDFGIAKDVQTSHATIVGTGFAGKLNYVAPEQFGDYGREIGPWTDIYSLALVMLSVASGRQVDMGKTLVEAVDKRRAGPDLSGVPDGLRPIFARMLAPDPAQRFRTMAEVIAALDRRDAQGAFGETALLERSAPPERSIPPERSTPPEPSASPELFRPLVGPALGRRDIAAEPPRPLVAPPIMAPIRPRSPPRPKPPMGGALPTNAWVLAGGAAAAVLALGLLIIFFLGHKPPAGAPGGQPVVSNSVTQVVNQAIASVPCSWLDYGFSSNDSGQILSLSGAAQNGDAANGAVRDALNKAGKSMQVDGAVTSLGGASDGAVCQQLNAFSAVREPSFGAKSWLVVQAPDFHPESHAECRGDPTQALSVITGDLGRGAGDDVALMIMSPDGELRSVFNGAAGLRALQRQIAAGAATGSASEISDQSYSAGNGFSVGLCEQKPGTYGAILVRGGGSSFDLGLSSMSAASAAPMPDFAARFASAAAANGWQTQMRWFQVDAGAIATPPPAAPSPQPESAETAPSRAVHSASRHSTVTAKPPHTHKAEDKPIGTVVIPPGPPA